MEFQPLAGNFASCVREKVMKEVVRGCESAAQLQLLLHDLTGSDDHDSTMACRDLVTKILRSFTEALSVLNYNESVQVPPSSPCRDDQLRKKSKKRNMQETWKITSMPIQDGQAWRKYGQKHILNAKHPRCYFRCTNKFDQGCQATKQVQRIQDHPPSFRTKYIGNHTCQDILKASLDMDSTADYQDGLLLNFESNTSTTKPEPPPFFFSSFPSVEEEDKPSSSQYLPSHDITKFNSCIPTSELPSTSTSGHGDVVSGGSSSSSSSSSNSFDMDMELIDNYLNNMFYDKESLF